LVPDKPLNYRNYSLGFKGLSALPGLIKNTFLRLPILYAFRIL